MDGEVASLEPGFNYERSGRRRNTGGKRCDPRSNGAFGLSAIIARSTTVSPHSTLRHRRASRRSQGEGTEFKLPLLGKAAALTDGRVADSCVDLTFMMGSSLPVRRRIISPPKDTDLDRGRGDLLLVRDRAGLTPSHL